jgi:hypothetical protein
MNLHSIPGKSAAVLRTGWIYDTPSLGGSCRGLLRKQLFTRLRFNNLQARRKTFVFFTKTIVYGSERTQ